MRTGRPFSLIFRLAWLLAALALAGVVMGLWLQAVSAGQGVVQGAVMGPDGPISGARVRVRATDNLTISGPEGLFVLDGLTVGQRIQVTAWYTGHYIAGVLVTPTVDHLTLTLRPHHTSDHPDYEWTSPAAGTSPGACGNCHPMLMPQWAGNAHGQAISNQRFFSLYNGTNISGSAVVSPGYRLDFPGTAGNCANCHAPGAAVDGYLTTPMDAVRDVITAGIFCDFCHKVGGVYLNPASGSVYPNAPGVQSLRVLRPPPRDNIFFGPFDDIPDPDTYLGLMDQSQYCAPCHQFSFWGTPIYESFQEWLASPYASAGVSCQDCHMAPNGDRYFALPSAGGLPHPPEQIPSHLQPGAADVDLLQSTVSMTVSARPAARGLLVTVAITNTGAGHHVPTDHPGRNLILLVTARDEQGRLLTQLGGPTVPGWGGDQAGLPGQGMAKILVDVATGAYPVISYWKPTLIRRDNRLPAGATDRSDYLFALPPATGAVSVTAELRFRRLFQPLAEARGWNMPDVVMATAGDTTPVMPWYGCYLPAVWR